MKKRMRLVGLGALLAAGAAFFLHPHKGRERREAVRRGGERLVRQGSSVTSLMGNRRHHDTGVAAEARARVEDALLEALGADGFALRVTADDDDSIAVRGEVASLDLIRRASEVIERARGEVDVVNLIRLRAPAPAR
ncbi:MAG: BON domain-containing protein [Candidatus Dormibacteria bacterium]